MTMNKIKVSDEQGIQEILALFIVATTHEWLAREGELKIGRVEAAEK
jgi:hypothetical protein